MPCFSKIQTLLIDLATIESAAKSLGIEALKRTSNSYTLKKGNIQVGIERTREGEKFFIPAFSGSGDFQNEIMQPLTQEYGKERMKYWAKKRGYTVSTGSKPNQYVLSKYS